MVVALNQAYPQTDKCFNLYKDQNCNDNISYMKLFGMLKDLGLTAGQTIWYKIENEQKF